jgi:hypothetical protein
MDSMAQRRWLIWGILLALTIGAILYPVDNDTQVVSAVHAGPAPIQLALAETPLTRSPDQEPPKEADPFAPRRWQAQPLPSTTKVEPVSAIPVAPPIPQGPPPLPFRYMGSLNDDGQQVVYLSRGEQMLLARHGEVLEGAYKVLAVSSQRIEFEHLATGEKQSLAIANPNY